MTGKPLFVDSSSEDSGQLFVYQERWNVEGHRLARQDWWAKVTVTKRGKVIRTGKWFKDNVGYNHPERMGLPWCYPYKPATEADVTKSVVITTI